VGTHRTLGRLAGITLFAVIVAASAIGVQVASSAPQNGRASRAQCAGNPWTRASFRATSNPAALGVLVLTCLKLEYPGTYRHDEVGIVALVHDHRFQNINEFGLTSTVQRQMATLGMPPITFEDGPGGLLVDSVPKPTVLPNELALGATFDPTVAQLYGWILGVEAHLMGYDGVQAPDLNLLRVPSWGRAMETFGESPVLAGELGSSEAVAIASQSEIPLLKHFGPYSQETDRHDLDQRLSERAYQEVYIRPFYMVLHALLPQLEAGNHAVGIMCSYGNVNATRACRSPVLARVLGSLGVNALIRSDLDVWVEPSALLRSGVDLIKPMLSGELVRALGIRAVDASLDAAVKQVFTTEFEDGLVNGKVTAASFQPLSNRTAVLDAGLSNQIEQRAAVLLKDDGVLPLRRGGGPIAVLADARISTTCNAVASVLSKDLATTSACTGPHVPLPYKALYKHLPYARSLDATTTTFTAPATGTYVAEVTTHNNTVLTMNHRVLVATYGASEFGVQRTAAVQLVQGRRYSFHLTWLGVGPTLAVVDEQPMIDAAVSAVRGARAAVVVAYDLPREGMDRSSLALPDAQDALITAIAAHLPTVVLLATDGAVTMPWLSQVHGVLEVWSPTGTVYTDAALTKFVGSYVDLLDGTVDPSGRLPETFPVSSSRSPMGVRSFWPGINHTVNLGLAPNGGIGIGYDWYRQARWPVLFPFGYGLSYTDYQLTGGTITSSSSGPQVTVGVRDTGGVAGTEVVQIYADWPGALNEPATQFVGSAAVTFTDHDAATKAIQHVVVTIPPGVLSVFQGTQMRVVSGSYCLEAATYDGDPHAWNSGSIALGSGTAGAVTGPPSTPLVQGSCPS
jgi:beta-glucosidase